MDLIEFLPLVAAVVSPFVMAIRYWRQLEKRDESHLIALICAGVVFASPLYTHAIMRCVWTGDSRDIIYPVTAVAMIFACWTKMDGKKSADIVFRFRLAILLNSVAIWVVCTVIRGLSCID